MIRQVAVFAIVWAYSANALWIPGGLDDGYWLSVLFPAPYYLLIGGIAGWLYQLSARRWPHWLVTAALSLLLTEWARWLFAGQLPFIYLAIPFMLATLLASYATLFFGRYFRYSPPTSGNKLGIGSASVLLLIVSLSPSISPLLHSEPLVSPEGAYVARCFAGNDFFEEDDYYVYVGPGRMPLCWFGYCLPKGIYAPVQNLRWTSSQTLAGDSPDRYNSYQGNFVNVSIEIQNHP